MVFMKKDMNTTRVRFNLPQDHESLIQYALSDDVGKYARMECIVSTICSSDTEASVLFRWINELNDNILFLNKSNEGIVNALLKLKWYTQDDAFVTSYQNLILNLVTAHPVYVQSVHFMFILCFSSIGDGLAFTEEEQQSLRHVHVLAEKICKLIPLSHQSFCQLLCDRFPYMTRPTHTIVHYVENILVAGSYNLNHRTQLLTAVIRMITEVDVMCPKQTIETYEQDKDSDSKDDEMNFPLAKTLDQLMLSMFNYIKSTEGWENRKKLYRELLTAFDRTVLRTPGACHIQYLMLYVCSFGSPLAEGFIDYLWKKVQDPSQGPFFRQMAAFYIGSFLSRAAYVRVSTTLSCLQLMCNWLHRYIEQSLVQDVEVHGTFHAVCQAVLYIFAFRSDELMRQGSTEIRSLSLDRLCACRLNPLRFVDPAVSEHFASLARGHQLAYVYPILERNKRNLMRSDHSDVAGSMIGSVFPFDPYLLKKSKSFIDPLYRVYQQADATVDDDSVDQVMK